MRLGVAIRALRRLAVPAFVVGSLLVSACEEDEIEYYVELDDHWPERVVYPGPGAGGIVLSNAYEDTLTFLAASSLAPVATVPIGLSPVELEGPHHVVVSPDGRYLYTALSETVPNSGAGPHGSHGDGSVPGYVLKIRVADARLVGSTRVDRSPGDLLLSPDGATLYVSHFDVKRVLDELLGGGTEEAMRSAIARIDTATMTREALVPVCPAEHGMALSADGATLYVACYGNDAVAVVDAISDGFEHELVELGPDADLLPENRYAPYAATFDPDGRTLWLSCWESGDLRAFNTSSGTMELGRTIVTGGLPGFGASLGGLLVVPRQSGDPSTPDDRLLVIDSAGAIAASHPLDPADCVGAHSVTLLPGDPDRVLVVCEGDHLSPGTAIRVDVGTGVVDAVAEAGLFPDAAAYLPGSGR